MSRYIDADKIDWSIVEDEHGKRSDAIVDCEILIENQTSIDLVRCAECKRVREDGGHANCGGYLYCRKWKTLVDEDCYCSWGEREGE